MAPHVALTLMTHIVITLATISAHAFSSRMPALFHLYNSSMEQTEAIQRQKALPFPIMDIYMPKENNLRTRKLLRKLGGTIDNNWMSIELPESFDNVIMSQNEIEAARDKFEKERVQTYVRATTDVAMLNNKSVSDITMFLMTLSTCRIRYEWEDLGVLFWPRYIKSGTCQAAGTCSWPPGMICAPGEPTTLYVLRWRCKRRKGNKKQADRINKDSQKQRTRNNKNGKGNRDNDNKGLNGRRKGSNTGSKRHRGRNNQGRRIHRETINKGSTRLRTINNVGSKTRGNRTNTSRSGHSNGVRQKFTCKWKRVPYYVSDSCACSCSDS